MGDKQAFQPLTREDRLTVVLYRVGIVISAIMLIGLAYLLARALLNPGTALISPSADTLVYGLYAAAGMSVFFIHLYAGRFKRYLKYLYFISLSCLAVLFSIGKGSLSGALVHEPYSSLLLLPLSGCLGFVTAKEAVCFQLVEGYILAMIMPVYLLLVSSSMLSYSGAFSGLVLITVLFVIFTLRKVIMPIAYDIGDKSAYQK